MPELPDVEVYRRHAAAKSLHKTIERVHIGDKRLLKDTTPQSLGRMLDGNKFERTVRHGKYLLLDTGDRFLVLHFGMTGDLQFVDQAELPEYTQAEFHFQGDDCLAYTSQRLLGQIFLVEDLDELIMMKQLGPDAIDVNAEQFCERFGDKQGSLKSALMDQSLIAGIGNVYSDEILFQLQLHPKTDVPSLDQDTLKRLFDTCQHVLNSAIEHNAAPSQMPSIFLLPHRKEDGRCPRCNGELTKITVNSRRAVICPKCQDS